jgi:hypothetical protein
LWPEWAATATGPNAEAAKVTQKPQKETPQQVFSGNPFKVFSAVSAELLRFLR